MSRLLAGSLRPVAALLVALLLLGALPAMASAAGETLVITPSSGPAGVTTVAFTGAGWPTNRPTATGSGIEISFQGSVVSTCATGKSGPTAGTLINCTPTPFLVPDLDPGTYDFTAVDPQDAAKTATATFSSAPTISLSSNSGAAGATITIGGAGYRPGAAIELLFDGTLRTPTAPCVADGNGTFAGCAITAPQGTGGSKPVTARDVAATGIQRSATASWTLQLTVGSVTLGATSGHWGSTVALTGTSWPASRTTAEGNGIEIRLGSQLQTRCATTSSGALQGCSITVPDWTPGAYTLRATDPQNEFNTSTAINGQFTVRSPAITLTPDQGEGGGTVSISGAGFRANSALELLFDAVVKTPTAPCATNATGTFSGCQIPVPHTTRGAKTVTARDLPLEGQRTATATYTVDFRQGTLTLNPASGPTGTTVSVTGTGWSYDSAIVNGVDITFAGQTLVTCSTMASGALSGCSFKVPALDGGSYAVEAVDGGNSFNTAATSFSVSNRAIGLSPGTGFSGSTVTVSGAGFRPSRSLEVLFAGTPVVTAGTCSSDAWGAFGGCTFTVPGAPPGAKTVTVRDGTDGASRSSQATYTVEVSGTLTLSSPAGAAGTTITATGSGWTPNRTTLNGTVIEMAGETLTTCATDGTGTLTSCSFRVPPQVSGLRAVDARDGLNPYNVASRSFTVLDPAISLSSAAGASGAAVTAAGTGFRADSSVRVEFDGMLAATCAADAWGAFSACQLTIPGVATKGVKTVRALDLPSGAQQRTAQTTYDVLTTVHLTPPRGVPGSTFTVSGEGFNTNQTVEVRWGATLLGTCPTNASGSFGGCTYTVAHGTPIGAYAINATVTSVPEALRKSASAAFSVVLPATITVEPAATTYGDTAALTATLATGGTAIAGRDVTFRLNGTNVGTATTNGSGVATLPAAALVGIGAGNHPSGVHASFAGDGSYTAAANTAALDVARREVHGSFTVFDKVYNGTTAAVIATRSLSNTVTGDVVSLSDGAAAFQDPSVGATKNVPATGFGLTGAAAGNYRLASPTLATTAAITPKALVASFGVADRTYDATTAATILSSTLTGVVAGDTVALDGATAAFASKAVGFQRPVTVSGYRLDGEDAGNYTVNTTASTAATITRAPLTITATAASRTYDGTTNATVTGLSSTPFAGDQVTLLHGAASFDTRNVGTGKVVTVPGLSLSGADAANYSVANANQTTTALANITKASVLGSFTISHKSYDGTTAATINPNSRLITGGVVAGDTVTLTGGSATFSTQNVGTGIPVTGTGFSLGGAHAGNYQIAGISTTTGDISPVTVTGSFSVLDKVYDGSTTATILSSSRSITGAVAGETLTLTGGTATFADEHKGADKIVTGTGFTLGGATASNYVLALPLPTTTADINPRTVTAAFTAEDKMYNGNTIATIKTRSITGGVLNGDDVTLAGGSASFADPDVGENKLVTGTGFVTSGPDGTDYALASSTLTTSADITPADGLVVTFAAADRAYDGTDDAALVPGSVTLHGLEGHPDADVELDLSGATLHFEDANAGEDKIVTLAGLALTGADAEAGNFHLASAEPTSTATIAPKPLTGSFIVADKPYDTTTAATITGRTLDAVVEGDDVALDGGLAMFASPNAGLQTVAGTSFQLAGTGAHNYALDGVDDASATITKVPLTITAESEQMIWGQSAPAFTSAYAGFVGTETPADLDGTLTHTVRNSSGATVTAGRSIPAGVYSITPGGHSSVNYDITYVPAELTVGFVAGLGSYKPDGLISVRRTYGYLGNGVYNGTGTNQTASRRVERGRQRTFYLKLQNDGGDLDTLVVRHISTTKRGFSVRYFLGSTEVTRKVKRGTLRLEAVAGGRARALRMVVGVGSRAGVGVINTASVRVTSSGRSVSDTVRSKVTATR